MIPVLVKFVCCGLNKYRSRSKTQIANRIYTNAHFFHHSGGNLCKFTQIMCNLHKYWSMRGHHQPWFTNRKSHLHKSLFHLHHSPLPAFALLITRFQWWRLTGENLGKKYYRSLALCKNKCVARELQIAMYVFGKLYNWFTKIYMNVICENMICNLCCSRSKTQIANHISTYHNYINLCL